MDSPQMFVSTLVIHCAYLVTLHWSFYLVNSSETEIPKADSFSSAFNNKIAELFFGFVLFCFVFLKRTNFIYCIQIWIKSIFGHSTNCKNVSLNWNMKQNCGFGEIRWSKVTDKKEQQQHSLQSLILKGSYVEIFLMLGWTRLLLEI